MFQSVLEQEIVAAEHMLQRVVTSLDPDDVPAREAPRLFERLDRMVRTATAGRTLLTSSARSPASANLSPWRGDLFGHDAA